MCKKAQQITVVDPEHPFKYLESETPPNYVCGKCGASGVKLWRDYQAFLEHQSLRCATCAAAEQKKDISDIDADGRRTTEHGSRTDQIGWRIPAVPTEENDSYWGYTSVPPEGCDWWAKLPTLPS